MTVTFIVREVYRRGEPEGFAEYRKEVLFTAFDEVTGWLLLEPFGSRDCAATRNQRRGYVDVAK